MMLTVFFNEVRGFFVKAFNHCVKWLPLDDSFITKSVLVDFEKEMTQILIAFKKLSNLLT